MKRVLFVDDDVPLLDGLRVRLHAVRSRWEMVFVESASRAIAEMELHPCDVVVTDVQMPAIDGVELLKIVAERWPESARIVLSGYAKAEQTTRLLPIAHQYVSKPCETHVLENVIERCLQLQDLLRAPRLREAVGRMRRLPAMPHSYARLRDLVSDEGASVGEVARAITEDSAIAAKVLQVVNSAFFRRAKSITKIDQAVTHLGFETLRSIAMSVELFSSWPPTLPQGIDPQVLQAHAHRVAAIARALTPGKAADDAMLAGLLHNIGYLVLAQQCPSELEAAFKLSVERDLPRHQAETEVIGASYAEVGAYLLGMWGLPPAIIEAVAFQHSPQCVAQTQFDVLAALVIAERLAACQNPGTACSSHAIEAAANEDYLRAVGAPFDWREAQERAQRAVGELES